MFSGSRPPDRSAHPALLPCLPSAGGLPARIGLIGDPPGWLHSGSGDGLVDRLVLRQRAEAWAGDQPWRLRLAVPDHRAAGGRKWRLGWALESLARFAASDRQRCCAGPGQLPRVKPGSACDGVLGGFWLAQGWADKAGLPATGPASMGLERAPCSRLPDRRRDVENLMGAAFCGQRRKRAAETGGMDVRSLFLDAVGAGWGESACGSWSCGEQPQKSGEGFLQWATHVPGLQGSSTLDRCWARRGRFAVGSARPALASMNLAHLVALAGSWP